jgi:hypothetical protein
LRSITRPALLEGNLLFNNYWLKKLILIVNIIFIGGLLFPNNSSLIPITGQALPAFQEDTVSPDIPPFRKFVDSVVDGDLKLKGLYIPSVLALEVVQQPKSQPSFVSSEPDKATQFGLASTYGTIGLLAHNFAGGADFDEVVVGEMIDLVYGDGRIKEYRVSSILRFQAIDPVNTKTSFLDLATQLKETAEDLFMKVYSGKPHLTLQTCISNGSISSWGRLFIIAEPISD